MFYLCTNYFSVKNIYIQYIIPDTAVQQEVSQILAKHSIQGETNDQRYHFFEVGTPSGYTRHFDVNVAGVSFCTYRSAKCAENVPVYERLTCTMLPNLITCHLRAT